MFKFLLSLLLVSGVGYADSHEKEDSAGDLSFGVIVNKLPGLSMKYNLPKSHIQGQVTAIEDKFTYTTLDYVYNFGGFYAGVGLSSYFDKVERTSIKWTGKKFEKVTLDAENIHILRIPIGMNKTLDEHSEIFGEMGMNVHAFEGDKSTPFDAAIGMRYRL